MGHLMKAAKRSDVVFIIRLPLGGCPVIVNETDCDLEAVCDFDHHGAEMLHGDFAESVGP